MTLSTVHSQHKYVHLSLPGLALLFSSLVLAQTQEAQSEGLAGALSEVIVTSSRVPQPQRTLGTDITVLDESEIRLGNHAVLSDLLAQQPGISQSRNGGLGATTSLRIRGEEGYRTLILLDGLRLGDPSAPQVTPQMEHLMTSGVSRVEILRGPQGLAYGADAGGVINIQTKRAQDAGGAELQVQQGSLDTKQAGAGVFGSGQRWSGAFNAGHLQSDGYNQQSADNVLQDKDGYRNTTLHGSADYKVGQGFTASWTGHTIDADSEYDGCYGTAPTHNCLASYRLNAQRVALGHESASTTHSFSYQQSDTHRDYEADQQPSFSTEGELQRVEYFASHVPVASFSVVWGVDWESASSGEFEQKNTGAHAELISKPLQDLTITAGARIDDSRSFGVHYSYRVSAARLQELSAITLKWRGSAGTGFRAPSPYEQSYNQGPFGSPPASLVQLREESSRGYDLGLDLYSRNWLVQLTWFDQQIEDAIEFDLAAFSGYLQTSGTSDSSGVELAARAALGPGWFLKGNYTLNPTSRPDGSQRLRRPRKIYNAGIEYEIDGSRWRGEINYGLVEDRLDETFAGVVALEDYKFLDASVWYQASKTAGIFLRVENALNEKYEDLAGYPAPDRALHLGLRVTFVR